MGAWDMIRRAASGLPSPPERAEDARPGLERNGLGGLIDPRGDGEVPLDSGHRLTATMFDDKPDWLLHIRHDANPDLMHGITVHVGTDASEVGDRIRHALGRRDVMESMREQMTPGLVHPGYGPEPQSDWPRRF